jgi:hypothetical protein
MRKLRIVALGVVAAVMGGVLFQLPASPFDRRGFPQRPVADSSAPLATGPPAAGPAATQSQPETSAPKSPGPESPAPAGSVITYPERGEGSYSVLPGEAAVIGTAGRLLTFQIAVEGGIEGIDRPELSRFVRETYGAPEGWASDGLWRFRQVGPGESADFRLLLVTPATRDRICGGGYDRYTSCRIGDRVVLNVARWVHGVPDYGAPLAAYRQYMLNHETGHRLGRGHELCRGPGRPAPVMQQQTLGLHGCTAYAWPYRDGERYKGSPGQYDDPVPRG